MTKKTTTKQKNNSKKKATPKKNATPKSRIKKRNICRQLKSNLSKTELIVAGEDLAAALDERDRIDKALEALKQEHRDNASDVTAKMAVFQGVEKDVECFEIFDLDKKMYRVERIDNGAIIESREMTFDECQGKLFDEDE